jgi:uncharacterized protein GlcG (DUF336 family)
VSSSPQLPNPYGPAIAPSAALRVAEAAVARAAARGWNVAVAVVDPAGDLVAFLRTDHVQRGSIEIAIEKARTSARFKRPTRAFEERLATQPSILRLPGVLPVEGGLPLLEGGLVVGAVGVSGALPVEDGECADAARAAL